MGVPRKHLSETAAESFWTSAISDIHQVATVTHEALRSQFLVVFARDTTCTRTSDIWKTHLMGDRNFPGDLVSDPLTNAFPGAEARRKANPIERLLQLRTSAKWKSGRIAIKSRGENSPCRFRGCLCRRSQGRPCCVTPRFKLARSARVNNDDGRETQSARVCADSSICPCQWSSGGGSSAKARGRVFGANEGRKGIYSHAHLQEESASTRAILDRYGRFCCRVEPVSVCITDTFKKPHTCDSSFCFRAATNLHLAKFHSPLRRMGSLETTSSPPHSLQYLQKCGLWGIPLPIDVLRLVGESVLTDE